jgi:flavin-dependent dehydrogenase
MFATIGLSEEIDVLGGCQLNNFRLHCGRKSISVPMPGGLAISREALDASLIGAAIAARVEFLPNAVARIGEIGDQSRVVRLSQGGHEFTVNARTIVVASGLDGIGFSDSREWKTRVSASSRLGAGCLFEAANDDYSAGTIWMAAGAGGYAGLVRVEDGRLNLAAAFDRNELRYHGSPAMAAKSLLEKSRFPVPLHMLTADWQGTVPLTRTTTPVCSHRVFLIGDAAGYVEPFTGEGMAWGLLTALHVVPWVERAISQVEWSEIIGTGWINDYRRLVGHRQQFCRFWARLLRSPALISMALSAFTAWPWLARRIIAQVNSHSDQGRLAYECRS